MERVQPETEPSRNGYLGRGVRYPRKLPTEAAQVPLLIAAEKASYRKGFPLGASSPTSIRHSALMPREITDVFFVQARVILDIGAF